MKKLIIITFIMLLMIPCSAINAQGDNAVIQITGTNQTNSNQLAVVSISASSSNPLLQLEGTLEYDSSIFTIFSIEENKSLTHWKISIDDSDIGMIHFKAEYTGDGDGAITTDKVIFNVSFIAFSPLAQSTDITVTNAKGKTIVKNIIVEKGTVFNQEEIDKALAEVEKGNDVAVPEPVYAEEDVIREDIKEITLESDSHEIRITNPKSSNTYLKALSVDEGNLSPAFSKLTHAYKLVIDENKDYHLTYIAEDDKASVKVQNEINNQVIISITAEDGSSGTYVLTIVRQKNYDTTSGPNNTDSTQIITPGPADTSKLGALTQMDLILCALGAVALVGIIAGAILVYQGSHE